MNNENSVPIADLFELNKRVSLNLWQMANEHGQPSNLSPRVIYPLKRDRKEQVRISEQEARAVCCGLLNNLSLYYSLETPTEKTYRQSGKKYIRAQTDLTMYGFDGQSLKRAANMEFKAHNCGERDIGKDIEKLVREGYQGNWFHILSSSNRGTFRTLFPKFKYGFIEYQKLFSPEEFSSKKISILFCFCVLSEEHAYMRHFFYEPSQNDYSEYVTGFFDASNLDKHWYKFKKSDFENNVEQKISIPSESTKNRELVKEDKLKWERVNNGFDLRVVNPDEVDVNKLKKLLTIVKDTESWGRNFNKHASQEFDRWLNDLDTPLKEQAYARLSNWFLCDVPFMRETALAKAALEFWKALFCAVPQDRLTSPESGENHKILPEKFALWWPKQLKCQEDC